MTDPTQDRKKMIEDFLTQYGPQPISEDEAANLDKPLTWEETIIALKRMKPGKSPGPDGFSISYYKTFRDPLIPHFLNTFNTVPTPLTINPDILEAHITVIPKQGRDTTLVSNYRPISLINVDMKLYTKILANRILPLLPTLVPLDQAGFIPSHEARDNTLKAISIHHWLSSSNTPGFFLSLDAEKAFDRVAWDYMTETLRKMGFRDRMLQYILALYSSPTARIRVNGHLLDAFSLSNGIRQGCPLSPIIFILTLEPMLCRLRTNPTVKGVAIKDNHYKLAAYADDILLFLTDPITTIPNFLKDFSLFKSLSNLQINFVKI